MRGALVLAALFAAAMILVFAVERRDPADPPQSSQTGFLQGAIEESRCMFLGQCSALDEYLHRFEMRDGLRRRVATGFATPRRAEPAPSAERRAAAQAILECSYEDFGRTADVPFLTEPGLAWVEGESPPEALVAQAESGVTQAQFELGFGLASGRAGKGGEDVDAMAFDWLLRAAEGGHPVAQTEVGAAFTFGYFKQDIDFARARPMLRDAVAQGEPLAMVSLAIMPPEDGRPLQDYAQERLDLELQSARACYRDAAVLIAERLVSDDRGFAADRALSYAIYNRVLGLDSDHRWAPAPRRGNEPDAAES